MIGSTRLLIVGLAAAAVFVGGAGLVSLIGDLRETRIENKQLRGQVSAWERVCNADVGFGDPLDDLDWLRRRAGR